MSLGDESGGRWKGGFPAAQKLGGKDAAITGKKLHDTCLILNQNAVDSECNSTQAELTALK